MRPSDYFVAYVLAGALLVLQAILRGSFRGDPREPGDLSLLLGAMFLWPLFLLVEVPMAIRTWLARRRR